MTLEEIDESLPNGLHDAQISSLVYDFERAVVQLKVCVLVGLPDDPEANRYRYRDGEIVFQRVLFCSVDKPENERILGHPGRIWFVVDRAKPESLPKTIANALDSDVLCYSLYILDWESEIHIAAKDVSFSWLGANSTVRSE